MISLEAVKMILGISENVQLNPAEMAHDVVVTFFPGSKLASKRLLNFASELENTLNNIGTRIVPFDSVWEDVPIKKRLFRLMKYTFNNVLYVVNNIMKIPQKSFYIPMDSLRVLCSKRKIKQNIVVICTGEQETSKLPMQFISSFKTNSIVTLVEISDDIDINTEFKRHFNDSMSLFAYHMTNIIIGINSKYWLMYNFNASHPIYSYPDPEFEAHILKSLIPKLAAPISPHKLSDFISVDDKFDYSSHEIRHAVQDLILGSKEFAKTNLYPDGKTIDSLPFRENFHKLIGKLHLDNRSGMSFGYFAFQLPIKQIPVPVLLSDFRMSHPSAFKTKDFFTDDNGQLYIIHKTKNEEIILKINDVWVLSIKSGANKTNFNPSTDLIKIGLSKGRLMIQWPEGLSFDNTYKPSFDTKVILAHALANALVAQVAKYYNYHHTYTNKIEQYGYAISHWHGYFNEDYIIPGMIAYGHSNSHVSCSSPQSAIYAFLGKYNSVISNIHFIDSYVGDIHIEPHHGINVSYFSLLELSKYILKNPSSTKLGNTYLK